MSRMYRALFFGGTSALTAYFGFAAPALAADESSAPAEDALQEVVVTAQKREQNVQSVPLSVQVIGETQLAAAGVENFEDFNRVAPSLLVRTDVTPINSTVAIRGIGTSAFGIGVEPSVAVVVDDVPLAFQARAFGNMTDISRVEVLAGPQSTLYGKSATAGLINIVTPDPTSEFSGKFAATGTTDSGARFLRLAVRSDYRQPGGSALGHFQRLSRHDQESLHGLEERRRQVGERSRQADLGPDIRAESRDQPQFQRWYDHE